MTTIDRPGSVHVRLLQSGAPVASGPVEKITQDGMYVRTEAPALAQGTYVEIGLGSIHRGIGAMVERWTAQGVYLRFASWNPQLFELMQRVAQATDRTPLAAARSRV